jgi:hypothetical protein
LEQLVIVPLFTGLFISWPYTLLWIAWVERRCGVWFRARTYYEANLGLKTYIRRPGVTPEAAATALQRYTHRDRDHPQAQALLLGALSVIPLFLLVSGGALLSVWLVAQ